jgi:DNA-directed RNA polymerase specialized sigma24 family protein
MTGRQRGWVLNPQSFEKLLLLLDRDRDRAGEKYQAIRSRLVRIFEWRGCGSPDTLADATIDRVSRRVDEGEEIRAGDPAVYFYGVARNVLKEYWTEQQKEATARRFDIAPDRLTSPNALENSETDDRMECLERCLKKLPRQSLELITRYYRSERDAKILDRGELAKSLGVTAGTLRIRAHRIRRMLETCVNEGMRKRADG